MTAADDDKARGDQPMAPTAGGGAGSKAGSSADAGATTESGPLGRIDPSRPVAGDRVPRRRIGRANKTLVAGFAGLIGSLLVLGSITDGVREQEAFALDTWATPFLHSVASPALDALMTAITTMGSGLILLPLFVVVVVALLLRRRFGSALFFSVASVGSLVIDATMKVLIQRPRPKLDYASVLPDYSFPSGHSMNSIVFYVGVALIVWSIFGRRTGRIAVAIAAVLAFAVGVSRIYLGYHYFTDVVGGFLAGIAWLLIVGAAFRADPKVWPWRSEQVANQPPGSSPSTTDTN